MTYKEGTGKANGQHLSHQVQWYARGMMQISLVRCMPFKLNWDFLRILEDKRLQPCKAHYLELSSQKVYLFGAKGENIPAWFLNHDWKTKVDYFSTKFLDSTLGLTDFQVKAFTIKISGPARAMLECLYLSPEKQDLIDCYQLMESLNNLRPKQVQELLENCSSVKVKRLFLYLAEKSGHSWFNHLQTEKIFMGKGKRSLVKNGVYIPKYQITVPEALENERSVQKTG